MVRKFVKLPLLNEKVKTGKSWIRRVDHVYTGLDSGYAFDGPRCEFGSLETANTGAYYLSYVEILGDDGDVSHISVEAFCIDAIDLIKVQQWTFAPDAKWAITVRDDLAPLVNQKSYYPRFGTEDMDRARVALSSYLVGTPLEDEVETVLYGTIAAAMGMDPAEARSYFGIKP